jgi:hypothetical protein
MILFPQRVAPLVQARRDSPCCFEQIARVVESQTRQCRHFVPLGQSKCLHYLRMPSMQGSKKGMGMVRTWSDEDGLNRRCPSELPHERVFPTAVANKQNPQQLDAALRRRHCAQIRAVMRSEAVASGQERPWRVERRGEGRKGELKFWRGAIRARRKIVAQFEVRFLRRADPSGVRSRKKRALAVLSNWQPILVADFRHSQVDSFCALAPSSALRPAARSLGLRLASFSIQ